MDFIQGTVKTITYYNEENAFSILKITVEEKQTSNTLFDMSNDNAIETVKGYLPKVQVGESYRFYGNSEYDKKYGYQFRFQKYEKIETTSKAGLIDYLSSDLFKGIGEKTAKRIVETLGPNAIHDIMHNPKVLNKIKNLSSTHKTTLTQGLKEHKANEQTLIKLYEYGISPKIAKRLIDVYDTDTLNVIQDNPYQLIEDIEGIGFERADVIARELGIEVSDPRRIRAMIIYLFNYLSVQLGHTHIEKTRFIDLLDQRLNKQAFLMSSSDIEVLLKTLIDEKVFVVENNHLTTKIFSHAENEIAEAIEKFSKRMTPVNTKKVHDEIKAFETKENIVYTDTQKEAILTGLKNQIMILNGGPGTGKTTVIKGLIEIYVTLNNLKPPLFNEESHIHLIAPTGRAAKRMQESANVYSQTIHRILGYGYDGHFMYDSRTQKDGRLFIIDEASMIDVLLAQKLFNAINDNAKIIIVGDEAQLPSVGSGQVLKDLIHSEKIPTVTLNTIHRQAEGSKILDLANAIRNAQVPTTITTQYKDRYVIEENEENFKPRLKNMLDHFLKLDYDLYEDIQILVPMYKGESGIHSINEFVQKHYNPNNTKHLEYGDKVFKIGDKVLQLSNRAEDGIMNGDQGKIIGIDSTNNLLYVDFFGTEIEYKKKDLNQLTLAYAMSIHKSQGSEYKLVIMPLYKRHTIMLKRKLIYTGITRAKETLILIGEIGLLEYAVSNVEDDRKTMLSEKLNHTVLKKSRQKAIDKVIKSFDSTDQVINDPNIPFDTLGESIGDKSPYDFMDQ